MQALVFLAPGFEEVEALTPIDFLRRAGITVHTVATGTKTGTATGAEPTASLEVEGSHGITVLADTSLSHIPPIESIDALVIPGGMPGSEKLAADRDLVALIKQAHSAGKLICAICAAPALVLGSPGAGLLDDKPFTTFPGFEQRAGQGNHLKGQRVVVEDNLITAIAVGAAAEFSVAIVRSLLGDEAAEKLRISTLQPV